MVWHIIFDISNRERKRTRNQLLKMINLSERKRYNTQEPKTLYMGYRKEVREGVSGSGDHRLVVDKHIYSLTDEFGYEHVRCYECEPGGEPVLPVFPCSIKKGSSTYLTPEQKRLLTA